MAQRKREPSRRRRDDARAVHADGWTGKVRRLNFRGRDGSDKAERGQQPAAALLVVWVVTITAGRMLAYKGIPAIEWRASLAMATLTALAGVLGQWKLLFIALAGVNLDFFGTGPPLESNHMQITRTADVGVRVMTHLATQPYGTRLTVAELADLSDAAVPFTSRILQRLVAARLVVSHRGYVGGFELARTASSISLLDIVTALDGPLCVNTCLPGGAGCGRKAWCGAHGVWANVQKALATLLASESLERLASAGTSNRARLGIEAPNEPVALTGEAVDG